MSVEKRFRRCVDPCLFRNICCPALTVVGVLPSLFGGPTMGRSFLSFAVVLGGLDLPVGTGNTPGIL